MPKEKEDHTSKKEESSEEESNEESKEEKDNQESSKTDEELTSAKESKELQTVLAQKKHWRKKFEESEKARKEVKVETKSAPDNERLDKIEFSMNHPEAKGIIDEISYYAKGRGISLDEAMKTDTIKTFVKADQEKRASEEGDLSPTGRTSSSSKGKVADMKEEKLQKNFGNVVEKIVTGKRGEKNRNI